MSNESTLITVQEYATKIGMTRQGVTSRIRRGLAKGIPNGLPTLQGIQSAQKYGKSYLLTVQPEAAE